MQSDGKEYNFNIDNYELKYNYSYFCFLPESFINIDIIQDFIKMNKTLFQNLLKFEYQIYSALTWVNLPSNKKHYVQYPHRDFDDYKFLTIIINWTDTTKDNGATLYFKGSHKNNKLQETTA